jgi:hypothetical protein
MRPALTTELNTAAIVGAGLIRGLYNVYFGAAVPAGGVVLTLRSTNPSALELSANGATSGTGEITIPVAAGATSASFYLQGVVGAAGTARIEMSAPGYRPVTSAQVTVVEPVIQLVGVDASTTSLSADDEFYVQVGNPSAGAFGNAYNVRPGHAVTVTIRNSQSAVARLKRPGGVTGQEFTLTIPAGQSNTATTLASGGIALDPMASGTTTVSAVSDQAAEFATASRQVTVSTPGMSMDLGTGANVGAGLICGSYSVTLGAPALTGGVVVTVRSSAPTVLVLSPNASTVGTGEITLTIPAGSQSASFYLQGMESQTGTVTITAAAEGFTDAVGTATVLRPILDISGLVTSTAASAADDAFNVRVGLPSSGTFGNAYNVRPGGAITVTLESSNAAVGALKVGSATANPVTVTIPAGSSSANVAFDPIAAGSTTVSITSGALPNTGARTVAVTP